MLAYVTLAGPGQLVQKKWEVAKINDIVRDLLYVMLPSIISLNFIYL